MTKKRIVKKPEERRFSCSCMWEGPESLMQTKVIALFFASKEKETRAILQLVCPNCEIPNALKWERMERL